MWVRGALLPEYVALRAWVGVLVIVKDKLRLSEALVDLLFVVELESANSCRPA